MQIIGKLIDTNIGRAIEAAAINKIKNSAIAAGALLKIVAPGATVDDGAMLAAVRQLAGTPSVLLETVTVILSDEKAHRRRDQFRARCNRRSQDNRCRRRSVIFEIANVEQNADVMDANEKNAFITD